MSAIMSKIEMQLNGLECFAYVSIQHAHNPESFLLWRLIMDMSTK